MTAQTANRIPSTKVVTGKCRASFLHVFAPRMNELSGKEEFSMTLLVPKSDAATVRALKAASDAAIVIKWGGKTPPGLQLPVHDGDGQKPRGGDYGLECKNNWVLNVKSKTAPGIVDAQVQPVLDSREFVSGDYCRVSISAYAWEQMGNRGVSFGLNNIQVLGKGEPLGSRARAEDEFDAYADADADVSTDDIPW
jgi:Enterobacter phage Enc34, ssDNA-binding protein